MTSFTEYSGATQVCLKLASGSLKVVGGGLLDTSCLCPQPAICVQHRLHHYPLPTHPHRVHYVYTGKQKHPIPP